MSSKSGGAKKSAARGGITIKGDNRRARHDYELLETFEAGIELVGSEVKSLRNSSVNLGESYAAMKGNELFLLNSNIPEYREANRFNHDPKRPRRLLLHRKQIDRLAAGKCADAWRDRAGVPGAHHDVFHPAAEMIGDDLR